MQYLFHWVFCQNLDGVSLEVWSKSSGSSTFWRWSLMLELSSPSSDTFRMLLSELGCSNRPAAVLSRSLTRAALVEKSKTAK